MIMFHDEIPYAVAQSRGELQQKLLEDLTQDVESMAEVDLDAAVALAESRLPPLH
jgi:kynurenine 3-monooxygenase